MTLKAVANEDTLLRKHCCSRRFLARANWDCVADTKYQKHFCVHNKCCARGKQGNICGGNNVSLFASTFKRVPYYLFFIIWLAREGKMNQIARCDWLPEYARWSYPARSGLPAVSRKKNFLESHTINPLLIKLVRSRWLDMGLVLFFASLWTTTSSLSIKKTRPISSQLDLTLDQ